MVRGQERVDGGRRTGTFTTTDCFRLLQSSSFGNSHQGIRWDVLRSEAAHGDARVYTRGFGEGRKVEPQTSRGTHPRTLSPRRAPLEPSHRGRDESHREVRRERKRPSYGRDR